jgi:hypothetical protein
MEDALLRVDDGAQVVDGVLEGQVVVELADDSWKMVAPTVMEIVLLNLYSGATSSQAFRSFCINSSIKSVLGHPA